MYFPVHDLWWLIIHVPSEWILLYQPQQSWCQLYLLFRSSWHWAVLLSHFLAKGKNECIRHLHRWQMPPQSTKPEEVAILCLGGPSSMAQSPGIFPLGRRREGKMLTTATPRNVDFLLHHPLSIPGELWCISVLGQRITLLFCELLNMKEICVKNWVAEWPLEVWKALCWSAKKCLSVSSLGSCDRNTVFGENWMCCCTADFLTANVPFLGGRCGAGLSRKLLQSLLYQLWQRLEAVPAQSPSSADAAGSLPDHPSGPWGWAVIVLPEVKTLSVVVGAAVLMYIQLVQQQHFGLRKTPPWQMHNAECKKERWYKAKTVHVVCLNPQGTDSAKTVLSSMKN